MSLKKDRLDDFTALFLPDILHPLASNAGLPTAGAGRSVKTEDFDMLNMGLGSSLLGHMLPGFGFTPGAEPSPAPGTTQPLSGTLAEQNADFTAPSHVSHYSSFVPIEAAAQPGLHKQHLHLPAHHKQLHMSLFLVPPPYAPAGPLGQFQYPGGPSNGPFHGAGGARNDVNWYGGLEGFEMGPIGGVPSELPYRDATPLGIMEEPESDPKRPRKKARRRVDPAVAAHYRPSKLTGLLDFQKFGPEPTYKLIDKDNNEVQLRFNGFLNGRFFTNDVDNSNYANTLRDEVKRRVDKRADPRVISCYRRNFIQVGVNMRLSNFSSASLKVLKLQTTEFGYIVTRVVKWFKMEVLVNTNVLKTRQVPIVISPVDAKEKMDALVAADAVVHEPIYTLQHVITLNSADIGEDMAIDTYYIIKKLQFKNATPNNGNHNFQNYYHMKIRLSAVVADLYYDDYMDDEFAASAAPDDKADRNEVVLGELVTEPIIVRGRNPLFYFDRNDVLIKNRLILSRSSYDAAQTSQTRAPADENIQPEGIASPQDSDGEKASPKEPSVGDENDDNDENDDSSAPEEPCTRPMAPPRPPASHGSGSGSGNGAGGPVPPLMYSLSLSSSINLKAMSYKSSSDNANYKYYPISNVYYLPPINVVYFPHRVHQQQHSLGQEGLLTEDAGTGPKSLQKLPRSAEVSLNGGPTPLSAIEDAISGNQPAVGATDRRRSSNVYFR